MAYASSDTINGPPTSSGSVLFARYAYPPNELGYCGPEDASSLLRHGGAGQLHDEVAGRAQQFEGAWTYLTLLARAAGVDDPLHHDVVEAYWVGNALLHQVAPEALLGCLDEQFRSQAGGAWRHLPGDARRLALPHHSFHVFAVYPWLGLLGSGSQVPLSILDRCRIRWGDVVRVGGEHAVVRTRPLVWDGQALSFGPPKEERVRWSAGGQALSAPVVPGDRVALHWDWVCDRLDEAQAEALPASEATQLQLANLHLAARSAVSPA